MARQAKEPCNWVPTATAIATVGTIGMVGAVDLEAEEAKETEEAEQADSSLEARLERAVAEPDYEREETFRYLKEYRKQKRFKQRLDRQYEAREEMRAEMDRILRNDAERSRESEAAMISYIEDGSGKLVKQRRTPARRFTQQDRDRADKNRVRYTRASWRKRLLAIAEGDETVTREQFQAFVLYGRCRGWPVARRPRDSLSRNPTSGAPHSVTT